MNKIIKIGDIDFNLTSSVLSIIKYKQLFGADVYRDIAKIGQDKEDIYESVEVATKCLYVLSLPNLEKNVSYEDFLSTLPVDLFINENNIQKLIDIFSMFVTTSSNNKNDKTPALKQ